MSSSNNDLRFVYSVSLLNREAREMLETGFPLIWVEGEISNFSRPSSGHWYFTLKDAGAQVRCAMFRSHSRYLAFTPENGSKVMVRAKISLYEARGDYQLLAQHMEEAGDGALRREFEQLKQKLDQEGLFAEEHKQPLPSLPKQIGVITSPTGAAIRDILSVLKRRFPAIPVIIYPVAVQGANAAKGIAAAIKLADKRKECDVLLLSRGGGSLEDLWSFNEEVVARAIYACKLPIVSGVGHEVDVSIADFVADRRAATPSAAAELLSPDRFILQQRIDSQARRLKQSMQRNLRDNSQLLDGLSRRLKHPRQQLMERSEELQALQQRLRRSIQARLRAQQGELHNLQASLQQHSPQHRLLATRNRQEYLQKRLARGMQQLLQKNRQQLAVAAHSLESVSPLATLGRGYAIVKKADGSVVRHWQETQAKDHLEIQLKEGRLSCYVEKTHEK